MKIATFGSLLLAISFVPIPASARVGTSLSKLVKSTKGLEGEYIVRFKEGVDVKGVASHLVSNEAKIDHVISVFPGVAVSHVSSQVLQRLAASPYVVQIEQVSPAKIHAHESDSMEMSHLHYHDRILSSR